MIQTTDAERTSTVFAQRLKKRRSRKPHLPNVLIFSTIVMALAACASGGNVGDTPIEAPTVAVQTIWSGAEDWATVSPDGKFAAFLDWDTGNLAARNLESDRILPITNKPGWAIDRSWAEGPLLYSPDGERIAYSYANASAGNPYRYELRVMRIADTLQQVLDSVPADAPGLTVLDWHREAGILYGNLYGDESSDIRIVRTDGSAPRVLMSHPPGGPAPHSAVFTPDGETVFYLRGNALHAMTSAGENDRALDLEAETLLGWAENGSSLVYNGRRANVSGNWRVGVRNGALIGEPILLHPTGRHVRPSGDFSRAIYFLEAVRLPRIVLVRADLSTGELVAPPRSVTSTENGIASNPAWSPDGSLLAYTLKPSSRPMFTVVIANEHGEFRELARVEASLITGLEWSADGSSLVIAARTNSRESSWVGHIDVATGRIDRFVMHPALAIATGPDGQVAYIRAALADDSTTQIVLLGSGRKAPEVVASYPVGESPRSISMSPDGDSVAVIKMVDQQSAFEIQLIPVNGGNTRTVARLERPESFEINVGSLPWTADRRHMLVLARMQGQNRFVSVDVHSGRTASLDLTLPAGRRLHPAIHPDGRRILYVEHVQQEDLKGMFWSAGAGKVH